MATETEVAVPTCEQLADGEGFDVVQRNVDDSWRHGVRVSQVFKRESDGTFWLAKYRLSTDQETNELRDGDATIQRVYPFEVTATVYRNKQEM